MEEHRATRSMAPGPSQETHGYPAWGLCVTVCHSSGKVPSLPMQNIEKQILSWQVERLPKYHLTQKCTQPGVETLLGQSCSKSPESLPLSWRVLAGSQKEMATLGLTGLALVLWHTDLFPMQSPCPSTQGLLAAGAQSHTLTGFPSSTWSAGAAAASAESLGWHSGLCKHWKDLIKFSVDIARTVL